MAFADVDALTEKTAPPSMWPATPLRERFQEILDEVGDPEAINDNYDTCPSRRIKGLVNQYRKALHGPTIAKAISLETLRRKCTHFGEWVASLERIGT